ncbi:MAG TPA: GNAT family N-acetyltransferase [Leptospiraceae bacterium]|nr:GNAT family N-acetyltransferase [Leptospiraceae bacterium]HNN60738.1 GNAT family N-acetyltransferase [Leptospiraceae bacterium]HNN77008.1 GNAT family N-acetyltransferase [Leptospiraceae bacterium]
MNHLTIQTAGIENLPYLRKLISHSVRQLQRDYYAPPQIHAALELITGLEDLILAGSLLVAVVDGEIVGCGGWKIDLSVSGSAEIRSFFVNPHFARNGVATTILSACETACRRLGVRRLYLSATLSGEQFYTKRGFSERERYQQHLSTGDDFELVRMTKNIERAENFA